MKRGPLKVGILMGSDSDEPVMKGCAKVLAKFGVPFACRVSSAHRTSERTMAIADDWIARGCGVFICAAGMAAHLAGAIAGHTVRMVIGVPIADATKPTAVNGLDALLATVQMPPGIPVATVAINGAENAAYLAIQALAISDKDLEGKLIDHRHEMAKGVEKKDNALQEKWVAEGLISPVNETE